MAKLDWRWCWRWWVVVVVLLLLPVNSRHKHRWSSGNTIVFHHCDQLLLGRTLSLNLYSNSNDCCSSPSPDGNTFSFLLFLLDDAIPISNPRYRKLHCYNLFSSLILSISFCLQWLGKKYCLQYGTYKVVSYAFDDRLIHMITISHMINKHQRATPSS